MIDPNWMIDPFLMGMEHPLTENQYHHFDQQPVGLSYLQNRSFQPPISPSSPTQKNVSQFNYYNGNWYFTENYQDQIQSNFHYPQIHEANSNVEMGYPQ